MLILKINARECYCYTRLLRRKDFFRNLRVSARRGRREEKTLLVRVSQLTIGAQKWIHYYEKKLYLC